MVGWLRALACASVLTLLVACSGASGDPDGGGGDAALCDTTSSVIFSAGGEDLDAVGAGLYVSRRDARWRALVFHDYADGCSLADEADSGAVPWAGIFLLYSSAVSGRYTIDPDLPEQEGVGAGQRGFCIDPIPDCWITEGALVIDTGEDDVGHPSDCVTGTFDVATEDGTRWAGAFRAPLCP